ncbi:hypothetical protein SARC_14929, partial [Sphaeroforma arctica JP610]
KRTHDTNVRDDRRSERSGYESRSGRRSDEHFTRSSDISQSPHRYSDDRDNTWKRPTRPFEDVHQSRRRAIQDQYPRDNEGNHEEDYDNEFNLAFYSAQSHGSRSNKNKRVGSHRDRRLETQREMQEGQFWENPHGTVAQAQ